MPNGDWTPPKPIQPAPMTPENQQEAPLVETLRATAEVVGRPRSVMLNKAADEIDRLQSLSNDTHDEMERWREECASLRATLLDIADCARLSPYRDAGQWDDALAKRVAAAAEFLRPNG